MSIYEQKTVKLSDLHLNTGQIQNVAKNPRYIKDERFEKLKKSIAEDPEMLQLREVIAYDNNGELVIIMGNMRYRAMKELGIKECIVKILPKETPAEKLRAYVIKDNIAFGDNDWDLLANEWELEELQDWGMECNFLSDDLLVDPLADVEELSDETYEKPVKNLLECPHCHHIDSASHFKKIEGDIPEDTNEQTEEKPNDKDDENIS